MKRLWLHAALFLSALLGLATPAGAVGVGEEAPDFLFENTWEIPPTKKRLSDYRGQVVLLEAFASW